MKNDKEKDEYKRKLDGTRATSKPQYIIIDNNVLQFYIFYMPNPLNNFPILYILFEINTFT